VTTERKKGENAYDSLLKEISKTEYEKLSNCNAWIIEFHTSREILHGNICTNTNTIKKLLSMDSVKVVILIVEKKHIN